MGKNVVIVFLALALVGSIAVIAFRQGSSEEVEGQISLTELASIPVQAITLIELQDSKVVDKVMQPGNGAILRGEVVGVSGRVLTLQVDKDILEVFVREDADMPGQEPGGPIEILGEGEEAILTIPGSGFSINIFGEAVTILGRLREGKVVAEKLFIGDVKLNIEATIK